MRAVNANNELGRSLTLQALSNPHWLPRVRYRYPNPMPVLVLDVSLHQLG